jgi:hypothetical protein
VPAHAVGPVDVTVTTPGGTSAGVPADQFTFVAAPVPMVTALSVTSGPPTGGAYITIIGSGFAGVMGVSFGGTAATGISADSDNRLLVLVPAHVAGTVDVIITTPGGTSAIAPGDQYSYVASSLGPVIAALSLTSGTAAGGDALTILGSGFTGATAVYLGGTPVATYGGIQVISDNAITLQIPRHPLDNWAPLASTTVYRNADGTGRKRRSTHTPGIRALLKCAPKQSPSRLFRRRRTGPVWQTPTRRYTTFTVGPSGGGMEMVS